METFKIDPQRFDLIITDQTMPDMTGEHLAKEIMQIRPEIPIILCTGFSYSMNREKAKEMGIREFIMKPFITSEIAITVRQVLDQNINK